MPFSTVPVLAYNSAHPEAVNLWYTQDGRQQNTFGKILEDAKKKPCNCQNRKNTSIGKCWIKYLLTNPLSHIMQTTTNASKS